MVWNVDEAQKLVTLVAAVLAARDRRDESLVEVPRERGQIKVACGLIEPQLNPGEFLTVISQRDHSIELADYGYITPSGELLSIPNLDADEPTDEPGLVWGGCWRAATPPFKQVSHSATGRWACTPVATSHDTPAWSRCSVRFKLCYRVGLRLSGIANRVGAGESAIGMQARGAGFDPRSALRARIGGFVEGWSVGRFLACSSALSRSLWAGSTRVLSVLPDQTGRDVGVAEESLQGGDPGGRRRVRSGKRKDGRLGV